MTFIDVPANGGWVECAFRKVGDDTQVLVYNIRTDYFSWYSVADCDLKVHVEGQSAFFSPREGAQAHGDSRPSLAIGFRKYATAA